MLLNLHVKNLAIIDEVDIDFSRGFNVLSGETGAGKSIILGSINLALGAKVSKNIIRDGASFALVELVFSYDDENIRKHLEDNEIECNTDEIIISRKITSSRSVSKVNGETVTLSFIQELAGYLIDIHGQHDNRLLINSNEHINILDDYIGKAAYDLKAEISGLYKEYQNIKNELATMDVDNEKRLREISLIEYEINEIENMALKKDEDKLLEEQFKVLSNMENITETLLNVNSIAGSECLDSISRAARQISKISDISPEICSIAESLSQVEDILSGCVRDIDSYLEENHFEQSEFEMIESRLDKINLFKAKYGKTIELILEYCDKSKDRLDKLQNCDVIIESLNKKLKQYENEILNKCEELSKIRKEQSKILCEGITIALRDLNFNDAEFSMEFSSNIPFSNNGYDNAQFIIKSNVGEGFKPLSQIASGGELSRVMLALKSVIANSQKMDSFIFDEIDAGISGRTAQKVAQKLYSLSKNRQIICITHLAQLASMADSNYIIEKKVEDGRTYTDIRLIQDEEVIDELARIIGGTQITQTVISSANEMIKLANELKTNS